MKKIPKKPESRHFYSKSLWYWLQKVDINWSWQVCKSADKHKTFALVI